MSNPESPIGARGGNALAQAEGSTAIGGDAGRPAPKPGGRGGDARASKPRSTVVGGRGGRGGSDEGMAGMDVTDEGIGGEVLESYIEGGMGGEAAQLDGRGGRGGIAPMSSELAEILGVTPRSHMKRPYWDDGPVEPGRGGDGPDTVRYRARRLIIEMIKAEYLGAPSYFTSPVWYERDSVPIESINAALERRNIDWRVAIVDHEYAMQDPVD